MPWGAWAATRIGRPMVPLVGLCYGAVGLNSKRALTLCEKCSAKELRKPKAGSLGFPHNSRILSADGTADYRSFYHNGVWWRCKEVYNRRFGLKIISVQPSWGIGGGPSVWSNRPDAPPKCPAEVCPT